MVLGAHPVRLKPPCSEKTRLRVVFQSAFDRHGKAVDETLRARGKVPKQEYERIRAVEDAARADRNAAQLALERHTQEHGC